MLIAHLSDAHIGPLPHVQMRDLLSKRLTGFINWKRGRSRIHDMTILDRLLHDLHGHQPDHIAMTGDIVNLGLPEEFPPARRFLERLGSPEDVSFVPGNHDAYVRSSLMPLQKNLGPWMTGDNVQDSQFPYVRKRDKVALIGLCSGIPTLPFFANGALGKSQLSALHNLLLDLGERNFCRIIMIHHPPHIKGAKPSRGLRDAADFEQIIAQAGAELILHGHNHQSSLAYISGPKGIMVPILGAPSISAISGLHNHPAGYHLLDIIPNGAQSSISLVSRSYEPKKNEIITSAQRAVR